MKKIFIISAYILTFWIFIPVILIRSSSFLNEIFDFKLIGERSIISGGLLLVISIPMLAVSIIQYTRFTGELPISAYAPKAIIKRGLYNYWRHPIYLFYVVAFFGISLVIRSYSMLLIVMPLFTLLTLIYTIVEESLMKKRFGVLYDHYRNTTGLLIPVFYQLLRYPAILFFKGFFRYSVKNNTLIPHSPPYFIVSEHKNYLDPFFIAAAIHHPVSFITTYEVYRSPLLRLVMNLFFGIPRKRFRHDYISNKRIMQVIERGGVIGLFPEGERSWTGETQNFKPEVLKVLTKMHTVPILPVRIHGSYHAWPRWSEGMRRYRITVEFGVPFFPNPGLKPDSLENQIFLATGNPSLPEKLSWKNSSPVIGIEKVLYMCIGCGRSGSFLIHKSIIRCNECGLEMNITNDLKISLVKNGSEEKLSIGSYYNLIKICPANYPREDTISKRCILAVESDSKFLPILDGELKTGNEGITINNNGTSYSLYYKNISSVTTESNYKLQVFDQRNEKLYQLEFPSDSVLRWQDIIKSEIIMKSGQKINTR